MQLVLIKQGLNFERCSAERCRSHDGQSDVCQSDGHTRAGGNFLLLLLPPVAFKMPHIHAKYLDAFVTAIPQNQRFRSLPRVSVQLKLVHFLARFQTPTAEDVLSVTGKVCALNLADNLGGGMFARPPPTTESGHPGEKAPGINHPPPLLEPYQFIHHILLGGGL